MGYKCGAVGRTLRSLRADGVGIKCRSKIGAEGGAGELQNSCPKLLRQERKSSDQKGKVGH